MDKKTKLIIAVVIILGIFGLTLGYALFSASVRFLAGSSSADSAPHYFLTVGEVTSKANMVGKSVRISGVIIGDSIKFDESTETLSFLIANIPADYEQVEQQGGLAVVLEQAVNDPNRPRIKVIYIGKKPDLLRHMTQVIVIGKVGADSAFYADEILLKCPERYEEAVPDQAIN